MFHITDCWQLVCEIINRITFTWGSKTHTFSFLWAPLSHNLDISLSLWFSIHSSWVNVTELMLLLTGVNRNVNYLHTNWFVGQCILLFQSRIYGEIKNIYVVHFKTNLSHSILLWHSTIWMGGKGAKVFHFFSFLPSSQGNFGIKTLELSLSCTCSFMS